MVGPAIDQIELKETKAIGNPGVLDLDWMDSDRLRWLKCFLILLNYCISFCTLQVRSRTRLRSQYINRRETVNSLYECEEACLQERAFTCRSFNYMYGKLMNLVNSEYYSWSYNFSPGFSTSISENCELSEKDSRALDITNTIYFDVSELHDYYQRESKNIDCIDGKLHI